jgi:hypothetical protein
MLQVLLPTVVYGRGQIWYRKGDQQHCWLCKDGDGQVSRAVLRAQSSHVVSSM